MYKRYLLLIGFFCCFEWLTANPVPRTPYPVPQDFPPDSLAEELSPLPEYMEAHTESLLRSRYAHYFTKADEFCYDEDEDVWFPDTVMRERLERLPHLMPMTYNNLVRKSIDLFTARRRPLVRYMLGMANFYFPTVEQILEEHGLPLELKYLAAVESGLNPVARSKAGACGFWQFMLSTGKIYGLEINTLVDERLDPVKATHAACRYFKDMYAIYGDWNLTIASYNCGPANVNKAIRAAGGKKDFWKIYPYLPKETRTYVPLFIAACYAMNYYCDHNICPIPAALPSATDTVMVTRRLHLQQVAATLQVDMELLRALNPQYRRDIIPGNIKPYMLQLPHSLACAFIEKEDSIYAHKVAGQPQAVSGRY